MDDNSEVAAGCFAILFGMVLMVGFLSWDWYKAGVQSEQYHRQGIELSTWNCFIGVKPAEIVVHPKPNGDK